MTVVEDRLPSQCVTVVVVVVVEERGRWRRSWRNQVLSQSSRRADGPESHVNKRRGAHSIHYRRMVFHCHPIILFRSKYRPLFASAVTPYIL